MEKPEESTNSKTYAVSTIYNAIFESQSPWQRRVKDGTSLPQLQLEDTTLKPQETPVPKSRAGSLIDSNSKAEKAKPSPPEDTLAESPLAGAELNNPSEKIGKVETTDEAIDQRLDEPRKKWSDLTDRALKDAPRSVVTAMREVGRQLFSMEKFDEELLYKRLGNVRIRTEEQADLNKALSNLSRELRRELGLEVQLNIGADGRLRQLEISVAPPETTRTKLKIDIGSQKLTAVSEHFSMRAPGAGLVLSNDLPVSVAHEQLQSKSVWYRQAKHPVQKEELKVEVENRNESRQSSLQKVETDMAEIENAFKQFELALEATSRDKVKVEELRLMADSIKRELSMAEKEIADPFRFGKRTGLSASEKEQRSKLETLLKQIDSIAMTRYRYAIALNEHGHNRNDPAAKAKAIEILRSIQDVDPETFNSPEVLGALIQAERGTKIDPIATQLHR